MKWLIITDFKVKSYYNSNVDFSDIDINIWLSEKYISFNLTQ